MRSTLSLSLIFYGILVLCLAPSTIAQSQKKTPVVSEWVPLRDGIGDTVEPNNRAKYGEKKFIFPQRMRTNLRPDDLRFNEPVGQQMLRQGIKNARFPIPLVNKNKGLFFDDMKAFAKYMKDSYRPRQFKPSLLVLHNTSVPSIAQRPNGFSEQNMQALRAYYGQVDGWHAGPAAFVDQHGIWVFTGFQRHGIHSPSWNYNSWGIEQLGEFSLESYNSGPGAAIHKRAIDTLAILAVAAGLNIHALKFHKEDPRTSHKDCPGRHCIKRIVQAEVKERMQHWRSEWESL